MKITRTATAAALMMLLLPVVMGSGSGAGAQVPAGPVPAPATATEGRNYRLGVDPSAVRGRDVPGLAVNPANPQHVVEVNVDLIRQRCEFNASFDGGRTWTGGQLESPADFTPPCRSPAGTAYPAMDQSVAFGSGQTVYTTFSSIRVPAAGPEGDSVLFAKSTDGGRSFGPSVVIAAGGPAGGTAGNLFYARPKLAVEIGAGPGNGDVVYVTAWGVGPPERQAAVIRSDNGGATWSAPILANAPGESAREQTQPIIGPDGAVYLAYRTAASRAVGPIVVARSSDRGATWTRTKVRDIGNDPNLEMAIDPRTSTLYLAYNEMVDGDIDVMLQRSTDAGSTWSSPLRVNDDPVGTRVVQHLPDLSVAPNGRLDVVWHDRRHAYRGGPYPACPYLQASPFLCQGDTYYAASTNGGISFSANRRITDRTINTDVGFDRRLETYTSYTPVSVPLGNDTLLFAWADSREGDFSDDNQDIYLARLDLTASGRPAPVERLAEVLPVAHAANLSRMAYPGGLEAVAGVAVTRAVVVNEGDVAGALAGAVLARAHYGPVLLSPSTGLPEESKAELSRFEAGGAFLVGDESLLSSQVAADAEQRKGAAQAVVRLAGSSPAHTGQLVANALDLRSAEDKAAGRPAFDAAVVVNGASAEAVAASALAAAHRLPILFVERDSVPAATAQALRELAIGATLVVGSAASVSDAVVAQLPAARRLAGGDMAATSQAVAAEALARGGPANVVYVGDASRPMDAALLGAAVARIGGVMVLAPGADPAAGAQMAERVGIGRLVDRIVVARSRDLVTGLGYRLVASDGGIFGFGDASFLGSTGALRLNQPIVGLAQTPLGGGYWSVAADGGIFAFGDASFLGSTGALRLNQPIVGMASTPSGRGYWLVARDGGVFAFGDASFLGSTGALRLNRPIVAISATPSGQGYRLVAADGGVFAFGDAAFLGSTGAIALRQPVVAMATTASGKGYWLAASDGGVFAFGDAAFAGSTGAARLNRPIVALAATGRGQGYWLVSSDGGVFAFGDARFLGSTAGARLARPVVGLAAF